jgi:Tfp pilus assembly protein PilF
MGRGLSVGVVLLAVVMLSAPQMVPAAANDDPLAPGLQLMREGDFEAAAQSFREAIAVLTQSRAGANELAQAHLNLGIAEAQVGNDGPAREAFAEALRLDPALTLDPARHPAVVLRLFDAERLAREAGAKQRARKRGFLGGAIVGAAGVAVGYFGTGGIVTQTELLERPNRAPEVGTIGVSPEGSALAGVTSLRFTANAVDRDGDALRYAWAFGDGAAGSGATVDHVYAAVGTYTVTLDVTDPEDATSSATATVVVGSVSGTWETCWAAAGTGTYITAQLTQDGQALRIQLSNGRQATTTLSDPRQIGRFKLDPWNSGRLIEMDGLVESSLDVVRIFEWDKIFGAPGLIYCRFRRQ